MQRRQSGVLNATRRGRGTGMPDGLAQDCCCIFAEQRRAPADLPARLVAEPLAGRITERAPLLKMLDIGEGLADQPMLVKRILVRLAQRRPQKSRILRLSPRHVLVGPG